MSIGEGDPRERQNVETTWNLYLEKQGKYKRTIKEVLDLAINPEIKPEFQQMAIRTLLELGVTSFNDWNSVLDSRLYENEPGKSNIYWARQLCGPQAQYAAELLSSYLKKTSSQGNERNYPKFRNYTSILLDLLAGLSQEHAENLFENFDYDFDSKNSLLALFKRDHSYDTWKEKSIGEAHKRIKQMTDSERVSEWYQNKDFLGFLMAASKNNHDGSEIVFPGNGGPDQNRIDFLAKEIVYAMGIYPKARIVDSKVDFFRIIDRLPEELRQTFVNVHIRMFSTQDINIVEKLVNMFPNDGNISAYLGELRSVQEEEEKIVPALLISEVESDLKNRVKEDQERVEEERIMNLMKKQKP